MNFVNPSDDESVELVYFVSANDGSAGMFLLQRFTEYQRAEGIAEGRVVEISQILEGARSYCCVRRTIDAGYPQIVDWEFAVAEKIRGRHTTDAAVNRWFDTADRQPGRIWSLDEMMLANRRCRD
jgi:hypothetical protein